MNDISGARVSSGSDLLTRQRRLRNELRLGIAFAVLIGITTSTVFWTLRHIKAEIAERLGASLQAVLKTSQNALRIWEEGTKTDVSVIAQSAELRSAVETQLAEQPRVAAPLRTRALDPIRRLLSHALREYGFTDFAVIAPGGAQIAAAHDEDVGRHDIVSGDSATVSSALAGRPALGVPFLARHPGEAASKPTMVAAAPVRNEAGLVIAALVFALDPARDFTEIMHLGRLGRTGETYAFDRQALLLTGSRFGKDWDLLSGSRGILLTKIRDPRDGLKAAGQQGGLTRMAQSAISGNSGVDLDGYRDYRGIPVIGAWVWDNELGMGLATEMNVDEAYDSWYAVRRLTFMMLVVIGAAVAAMGVILVIHGRVVARSSAYLQAANARQDALAVVSHELKNPLNTVALGSAALMRSIPPSLDEAQREVFSSHMERIRRAATVMDQLVRDLLDSAKLQTGHVDLEKQECDVEQILEQAIDLLGPIAGEKSIEIKSHINDGIKKVVADPTRLAQVLSNLLTNAVKFTPARGRVQVQANGSGNAVQFEISDTGPGIPPDELPHVFDQYWQAKRTQKMGTGLGLFIAKSLVELHGGEIQAKSELGRGTTFSFSIPAVPTQQVVSQPSTTRPNEEEPPLPSEELQQANTSQENR